MFGCYSMDNSCTTSPTIETCLANDCLKYTVIDYWKFASFVLKGLITHFKVIVNLH
jgi:hypothetical protein